jgi:prepilin signal peptidase PulO-like enzyme (type II secretory pathway)
MDAPVATASGTRPTGRAEWIGLAAGVAVALAVVASGPNLLVANGALTLAIAPLVVWIAWRDVKHFTISDAAVLAIGGLAVAARWEAARYAAQPIGDTLLAIGVDALAPGGLLLLFREIYYRRRGYDGLGLGDVKLATAGGILVGVVGFSWALFGASLAGLCYVVASRIAGRILADRGALVANKRAGVSGNDKIAFGALLAPALLAVWIGEQAPLFLSFSGW